LHAVKELELVPLEVISSENLDDVVLLDDLDDELL